jgi:hypothetical protein
MISANSSINYQEDIFSYTEAQELITRLIDPDDLRSDTLGAVYLNARRKYPLLPENPSYVYRAHWQSWATFFGILQYTPKTQGVRPNGIYLTLPWFRKILELKNIKTFAQYKRALPELIKEYQISLGAYKLFPSEPHIHYTTEHTTQREFFGNISTPFYSWKEFTARIKELGLKKQENYWLACERDKRLPANPWRQYSPDWTSWSEVFETARAKMHIERVSIVVAQTIIRDNNLSTMPRYSAFVKKYPELNLPSRPHKTYALSKYGSPWKGGGFSAFLKASHNIDTASCNSPDSSTVL